MYSILFTCVTFLCLDRAHLQNVMVTMLIITKKPEMEQLVFEYVGRGVTKWEGEGAYSGEQTEMLLTVVSKRKLFSFVRRCRSRTQTSLSFWMTTSQW